MPGRKVVIIGGGLIGLSIARALTERGVSDVLILERASLASGGTGKSSGIVRAHYGVPSIAKLSWNSIPTLERLGAEVGFRQVGYSVIVGDENVEALKANVTMQQRLGIDTEIIDVERLAAMWPYMEVSDVGAVAYEPRGGFADATQLALLFGQVARSLGAKIRQNAVVDRILTTGDTATGVQLVSGEVIDADEVIVAAGWWSKALLETVGIAFPCDAYRSELLIVDAGEQLGDLPVVSDLVSLQYCRIEGAGQLLIGNSNHDEPGNKFVDPDSYSNTATETSIEKYGEKVLHRFPGFPNPSVTHTYAGVYDVPPDWNPVIQPLTAIRGLTLAAGFAGHGFKMSPAVGDLVAELLIDGGSSDADIHTSDFRLERFTEGDLLTSQHAYVGAGQMR